MSGCLGTVAWVCGLLADGRLSGGTLEDEVGAVGVWLDDGLRDDVAVGGTGGFVPNKGGLFVDGLVAATASNVHQDDGHDDEENKTGSDDSSDDRDEFGMRVAFGVSILGGC